MKISKLVRERLRRREKPTLAFSPVLSRQKITSLPKAEYLKTEYLRMLNRGCERLTAEKLKTQQSKIKYIATRSAELAKEIDSGGNMRIAIIDFKIDLVKNEIDECQKKLADSDNKNGKEYHLPKGKRRSIEIRIADLKYNLKNLFEQRDLIFI